jgi:putative hydrolase of the HAD superfamily
VQTSPIKAVLFDFDGVLTTDKTGSLTTTRYLSDRTGIALSQVQAVFRKFNRDLTLGRRTHEQVWDSICGELGRGLGLDLLKAAFESTPMSTRMLRLAKELRSRYAVGIVTDNKKDRIDHLKKLHDLSSVFELIAVSAEVGVGKDDPKIFLGALEQLRVGPDECIFIDNSRENLIVPGSLGIKTVCFDDEKADFKALLAALRAHGAIVSDNTLELAD